MSKKVKDDTTKKPIPSVEDNRDKTKKSNEITISNFKMLDTDKDKDKIDKINKEKQDLLHNPYYSIDLNTNKVKQNDRVSFRVLANKPRDYKPKDDNKEIIDLVHQDYIRQMQHFNIDLDKYLGKTYTTIQELEEDIYSFNSLYDKNYYNGFNYKVRNYADEKVKQDYLNKYADAIASTQYIEIKEVCNDIIEFVNEDIDNTEIKRILDDEYLKDIQKQIKDAYSDNASDTDNDSNVSLIPNTADFITPKADYITEFVNDFNKDDVEIYTYNLIKHYVYTDELNKLNAEIESNKKYYKEVSTLYKAIDNKILKIVSNFSKHLSKLEKQNKTKAVKNIVPTSHTFNLVAPKIFNTTYKMGKYTSIDKSNNLDYDVRLNIVADEINDLRDIIFQEDITNKTLSLLPIDLALFIGFTDLSAINGNNIPINMQDTLRYITESKNLKLKDNKKLLQLYEDRLRTFDKFKVKAIITNKETNKQIRFLDPISILENARVLDTSSNQISYIIGRSAILVILNYLADEMQQDYKATFSTANSYINDSQSNTIYTLNMKYYLIIKILQMGNSKERLNKYQPKINLNQLYEQTALLKGVDELSKTEKARLRQSINKYLEHLKGKGLLLEYDYKPFKEIASESTTAITKKSDAKDSIYIKL